jgi:hypothetical protein
VAEDTSQTSKIVIDREEQRRALARVYSLVLSLAVKKQPPAPSGLAEPESSVSSPNGDLSQESKPVRQAHV